MEINSINQNDLQDLIKSNYLSMVKHPYLDLFIISYTKKTAFEAKWSELTLDSRGLIIDKDFNIVSRPFRKFFEPHQLADKKIDFNKSYEVFEKLDGALLISYWVGDSLFLTTKGKFDSYQAIVANKIFKNKYKIYENLLDKNYTYVFELISPLTTNIVDYGEIEDLFLLDVIDTKYNRTVDTENLYFFKTPKKYNLTFNELINDEGKLPEEGYVVKFENDFRLKIKKKKFKYLYGKNQELKKKILSSLIHNSKNNEFKHSLDSKKLYQKATDLLDFIRIYLVTETPSSKKIQIIEYFKSQFKNNVNLDFIILERLFMTSQYYSIKIPYDNSFLKA